MTGIFTPIPPSPPEGRTLRVAVYCRVSSSRDSQAGSLRNQQEHFESLIRSRPDWEFAGSYIEKGRSGTGTRMRPVLQHMLLDARNGLFDLIVTKSVSRFARNTADCLSLVSALRDAGVIVYFEREKLYTDSQESDFLLPILASLAEDESRTLSDNSRWSVLRRYQNGTFRLSKAPYGYDLENGQPVINDAEAAVIRRIFACLLQGEGTSKIAQDLNAEGIPCKRGGAGIPAHSATWSETNS